MANKKLTKDLTNAVSYARPIVRTNGDPLDKTGFYETITEANTYAAGADAYVGQIINVITDSDVQPYVIKGTAGNLKRIVCDNDTPTFTSATIGGKTLNSTGYSGNAATATALTSNAGSDSKPVYFSSGKPVAITNIDLGTSGIVKAASFTAMSDKHLKENIVPYTPTKNTILDLPIYKFDFINTGSKNHIGCLAQDLQKICPEIVHEDENGYLSIEESKIVYLLIEEVKQLRKELDELREEIQLQQP